MGDADQRLRQTTEIQATGCWLWHGHIDKKSGYGRLTFQGRTIGAHRLAYETWVGPIPAGLHVDHICRYGTACARITSRRSPRRRTTVVRGRSQTRGSRCQS